MIFTYESGSQEDQFDEKKWRQKISWDYPFKQKRSTNCPFLSGNTVPAGVIDLPVLGLPLECLERP